MSEAEVTPEEPSLLDPRQRRILRPELAAIALVSEGHGAHPC